MNKEITRPSFGIVHRWVAGVVSSTAFAVYAVLATYADRQRLCFPSMKTLARDLAISESTILRAVKELEKNRVIAVERRKKRDGSNLTNLYRIASYPEELKGDSPVTPGGGMVAGKSVPRNKTTWIEKRESRHRAKRGQGKYQDLGWGHVGGGHLAKFFRRRDVDVADKDPAIDWDVLDRRRDELLADAEMKSEMECEDDDPH